MARIALALGRDPGSRATLSVTRTAAQLYQDGLVDFVLLSGRWSVLSKQAWGTTEAASMKVAIWRRVPNNRLLLDEVSRDTVSNFVEAGKVLQASGIISGTITVVTVPYANHRAAWLAEKVLGRRFGINAVTSDYQFASAAEETKVAAQESNLLLLTWLSLAFVRRGNLAAIARRLRLWHPGYRASRVERPIHFTP